MGGPSGPPDKPGEYKVIPVGGRQPEDLQNDFDVAESQGYSWTDLNDSIAVFYKNNRKKDKK